MAIASFVAALFIFQLVSADASAEEIGMYPAVPTVEIGEMMSGPYSQIVPVHPPEPGMWELKIVPTYVRFTDTFSSNNISPEDPKHAVIGNLEGWGLAVSLTRSRDEHWARSFLVSGIRVHGTEGQYGSGNGPVVNGRGGPVPTFIGKQQGLGVLLNYCWIYSFGKPDSRVRWPLLWGLSLAYADSEIRDSQNNFAKGSILSPGIVLGAAVSVKIHEFRAAPFALATIPGSEVKASYSSALPTGFSTAGSGLGGGGMGAGVNIDYLPWGFGFTWIPRSGWWEDAHLNVYTLRWTKKWS